MFENKNYYLYIPYNYSVEEATIIEVISREGNKVKFNWLETDIDDNNQIVPTGELLKDLPSNGEIHEMNGIEYIVSDDFWSKHTEEMAFKYDAPKEMYIDRQGKCDDIDVVITSEYDRGDYWTPPSGPDGEIYCSALGRSKGRKICCMENCPKGPLHFMEYGITDNLDYDEIIWKHSDSYF